MNKKLTIITLLILPSIISTIHANTSTNKASANKIIRNTRSTTATLPAQSSSNLGENSKVSNHENMIQSLTKDYYLVFFTSSRCGPCRQFKPEFNKFISKYNFDYKVIDIASDAVLPFYHKLMSQVKSVPTLMLVDKSQQQDGIIISYGSVSCDVLERITTKVSAYFQIDQ